MISVGGQLVINAGDIPILIVRGSAAEAVADEVETVALGVVVWKRKAIKVRHHDTVVADVQWVHAFNLIWCQTIVAGGDWMVCACTVNSSARTGNGIRRSIGFQCAKILDHAIPQRSARDDADHAILFPLTSA